MELKTLWDKVKAIPYVQWLLFIVFLGTALSILASQGGSVTAASTQEARLAQVLSTIEYAGKVEVALYYPQTEKSLWNEDSGSSAPVGAVIVAQGDSDISVRLRLTRAIQTLLGISQDAVEVFAMAPN